MNNAQSLSISPLVLVVHGPYCHYRGHFFGDMWMRMELPVISGLLTFAFVTEVHTHSWFSTLERVMQIGKNALQPFDQTWPQP